MIELMTQIISQIEKEKSMRKDLEELIRTINK